MFTLKHHLKVILLLNTILLIHSHKQKKYEIPTPEIQIFTPKGFRLCISDSPGIDVVTLNANINKTIEKDDRYGQITRELFQPTNGRWTFIDKNIQLNVGDNIYYKVYLHHNNTGYGLNGHYIVKYLKAENIETHHYHECGPDTKRYSIASYFKSAPKHEVTRTVPNDQTLDVRFGSN